jgi:hypothetical protein
MFVKLLVIVPTLCVTTIKLSEKVKAWSAIASAIVFKTAKAVLLQTDRFLNLMAVTLCVGMTPLTLCVTHRWSDAGCIPTQSVGMII